MGEIAAGMATGGATSALGGGGLVGLLSSLMSPQSSNAGAGQPSIPDSSFGSWGGAGNAPNQTAMPAPQTDAAGAAQGFNGIAQGFEGLTPNPSPTSSDDPFQALFSMFGGGIA